MQSYPEMLRPYLDEAKSLVQKGVVKDILFSEGVYEVEVQEREVSFWPFIQIDDTGKLLDFFCSCGQSGGCLHGAIAYLAIFHQGKPLHVLFRNSFWRHIFLAISKELGFNKKLIKEEKDRFVIRKDSAESFIFIAKETKAKEKFLSILTEKKQKKEEISFKLAHLPLDEIQKYQEKKASLDVQFIVSFWFEIAQWLFFQSLHENYTIQVIEKKGQLPQELSIHFSDCQMHIRLIPKQWEEILPYLSSVPCNLKTYPYLGKMLSGISYDEKNCRMHFSFTQTNHIEEAIDLDGWQYVYQKGFYRKKPDEFFEKQEISKEQIAYALDHYTDILQKYLPIDDSMHKYQYNLFFDQNKNLHIEEYLLEKRDMQKPNSHLFENWAYIEGKGFFKMEKPELETLPLVIEHDQVADFVHSHRIWLQRFEGFSTHVGSFSSSLSYQVTEDNLIFSSHLDVPQGYENSIDFGEWIYIPKRGFYAKKEKTFLTIHPGMKIAKEKINDFISTHREELETIDHFFTVNCPLEKVGISIQINPEGLIVIQPQIHVLPLYQQKKLQFFKDYVYIFEEGFFPLPAALKLPEGYEKMQIIPRSKEGVFLLYELEKAKRFALFIDPKLQRPLELHLHLYHLEKEEKENITSYIAGMSYQSELGVVSAYDIWLALQEKKRFLFSQAGLLDLQDFRFRWLMQINKKRIFQKKRFFRFNSLEWIRLCLFEEIKEPQGYSPKIQNIQKILKELYSYKTDKLLNLSLLHAVLRSYQVTGVGWLWFLYCHGLSGILCDEMGLGKTHQAMALLASSSFADTKKVNKYLVICPTSVIYHWEDLLHTFVPHFRVLTYHGLLREIAPFKTEYDILLTSYGILRSETKTFKELPFEIAIFDEMQIAKNRSSKTHQALKKLKAKMKMGLTGTPIENRLLELKALFDIALPDYLPQESIFVKEFVDPIEKLQDLHAQELLSRLIKPFVLRRKKMDVLQELPEKTEEISYCDLSEEQVALYNETIGQMQEPIEESLEDAEKPIAYAHVFSLLTKLKQICDHPSLVLKDIDQAQNHFSGKWELFVELLTEAQESDLKVVVFSQYLDMIEIILQYLQTQGIAYASITGATQDRKEQIKRFKEDPKCMVFVGSLLAAGLGIDLSSASVVIHYDRWWNPAKENQATDRVHRIGQTRGVQVFKLVCKNTIEERIHQLIEKKTGLFEETIKKDDQDQIKTLSREEIRSLLRKIEG